MGLLASRGRTAGQYHPLVRDFLLTRLRRDRGDEHVLMLHRRVAGHLEGRNWRAAAHHYAAAGDAEGAHRVISGAALEILGTGDFVLAESYVVEFPIRDTPCRRFDRIAINLISKICAANIFLAAAIIAA